MVLKVTTVLLSYCALCVSRTTRTRWRIEALGTVERGGTISGGDRGEEVEEGGEEEVEVSGVEEVEDEEEEEEGGEVEEEGGEVDGEEGRGVEGGEVEGGEEVEEEEEGVVGGEVEVDGKEGGGGRGSRMVKEEVVLTLRAGARGNQVRQVQTHEECHVLSSSRTCTVFAGVIGQLIHSD